MDVSKKSLLAFLLCTVLINGCDNFDAYCTNPAPLVGDAIDSNPAYIIELDPAVDFNLEQNRLTSNYDIKEIVTFENYNQFFGVMTVDTRERMRCEGSVRNIFFSDRQFPAPVIPSPVPVPGPTPPPPSPAPPPAPAPPPPSPVPPPSGGGGMMGGGGGG